MLHLSKIIAWLTIAGIAAALILGISADADSEYTHTEIYNVPGLILWQALTDTDRFGEWHPGIRLAWTGGSGHLQPDARLEAFDHPASEYPVHVYEIRDISPQKQIAWQRTVEDGKSLITGYTESFQLRPLPGGETELTCRVTYRCGSMLSRLYDRFYLHGRFLDITRRQMDLLKRMVENL